MKTARREKDHFLAIRKRQNKIIHLLAIFVALIFEVTRHRDGHERLPSVAFSHQAISGLVFEIDALDFQTLIDSLSFNRTFSLTAISNQSHERPRFSGSYGDQVQVTTTLRSVVPAKIGYQ